MNTGRIEKITPPSERDKAFDEAAALCDQLGDEEFWRRAKTGNMGIAKLAQRHYLACAAGIRALKRGPGA